MAAGHILRMTRGRPFVQLKIAVSGDGLIAPGDGAPRWVTGPRRAQFAHLLRARADAILVGRKTVADDDPELTCRLPGLAGRSPRRVVLDAQLPHAADRQAVATAAQRCRSRSSATPTSTPPPYPAGVEVTARAGRCRRPPDLARRAAEPARATASRACWSRAGRPLPARSWPPTWSTRW